MLESKRVGDEILDEKQEQGFVTRAEHHGELPARPAVRVSVSEKRDRTDRAARCIRATPADEDETVHDQAAALALEADHNVDDYPELLTLAEAAELLGTTPHRVESAATAGTLPAKQLGGSWRIIRSRLRESTPPRKELSCP